MVTSRIARRLAAVLVATLVVILLTMGRADAHEHRHVGPYEIVVGWRVEPALVEQPNGLDLRVTMAAEGAEGEAPAEGEEHAEGEEPAEGEEHAEASPEPVTGLEETLQAEVIFGDRRMPLELRAAFGEPGAYTADVIPTVPGSYIFHITGEINGTAIDEEFNSADGEFSDIEPLANAQFPEPVSRGGDLQTQLAAAEQAANSARLLGIAGLVAGLLGLGTGLLGLVRRR